MTAGNRSAEAQPLDFFISYSPVDERWATWVAATLEAAGYRTMLQVWDFVAGTNFIELMDRGVSRSAVVVAILSRNYLTSRYGRMEWQAALRAAPDNPQTKLMTVRVEECDLSGLLATITYVDLVGVDDPEQARTLLLDKVRHTLAGRARPDGPVAYPGGPARPAQPAPLTPPGTPPAGPVPPTAGPRPAARRIPVIAPEYPAAAPVRDGVASLTVLHVAGPGFGRAQAGPADTGDLQARIFGEVTELVHGGAPTPDLLVVSGDLTASGSRQEFDAAFDFLSRLRIRLGLGPERLVVVPGAGDVNRAACRSYFSDREAEDEQPTPPYWPKWRHFTRLFRRLYEGFDDIVFEDGQPWTLFTLDDLRVVVAGLNTSMAVSHRGEDQYGLLTTDQAAWFAQRLRPYENDGWLRLGVLRHPPGEGPDALRDTATFTRLVAPRLNLLLPGPGPQRGSRAELPGLVSVPVAQPGACRLVSVLPDAMVEWVDQAGPGTGEPRRTPVRWQAAEATFRDEQPVVPDTAEVRETADPTSQLLDRIEEVCRARYERVRIQRVRSGPPYLVVTYNDDGFVRQSCVAAHAGEPTLPDIEAFRQLVRAADPELGFELVYAGDQPSRQIREEARRAGVRMRSFTEFQGLLDLRSYVAAQTARLVEDRRYLPHLYVPQRFSEVDRVDRPVRAGLVEELLSQVSAEHGRFILVLGDFGRGKTFALREVARRIPEELPHLTPILFDLRALDKAHSIDGLVAAHFADHEERSIDLGAFHYMLRQGRIVLLFDGFDELVTRTTYERATDHLDTLLSAAVEHAKIVVTSRTQHFQSHGQVLTALGERVGLLPQRRVLSVEEFTPEQIRAYLVNHYRDEAAADDRLRLISSVKNLIELSHNPRMLSFVADLDEARLRTVARAEHGLSAAGLYREILSAWLQVEERRARGVPGVPAGLGLADLWQAVTSLALRLWEAGESRLGFGDLAEVADTLTGMLKRQMSTEQATHALGTGTLLVRDEEGLFGFIHSSVVEWLVANAIAGGLAAGDARLLSRRVLTQLTVDFLCDLVPDVRLCVEWVTRTTADPDADAVAEANARKVSARLRIPANADLRGAVLRGEDLSYRDFTGVDFTGADLTDTRLVGTTLAGAVLRDARLVGSRLDEAVLAGADLRGADLTRARLTRTDLRRVNLTGSRWRLAALIAARTDADLADRPELRGAAIAPGMPVQTELAPALTGVPYGFHIQVGRLPQALAYSADGNTLAVGCDNGGILICDTLSGLLLRTLQGHHGRVYAVAAAGDAAVASAGSDGTVRMWDAATGAQRWVRAAEREWVWPLVLNRRGTTVAVSDSTGMVELVDAANGAVRHALPGPAAPVWTAAFRPDDTQLACAGSDGVVQLWDVATGRLERRLAGHGGSVYRLAYSPDGRWLATSDEAGTVRVWDVATGQLRHRLTGHARSVYTLGFHPSGRLLASADTGGSIRLWRLPEGAPAGSLDGHFNAVYQVLFSPDGAQLASGDSIGTLRLWAVAMDSEVPAQLLAELTGHRAAVWPGVFRPDGGQLATTSVDGTTRLWDTATGQCRHTLRGHGRRITSVSFNATGSLLAAAGNDGGVRLWDPVRGRQVDRLVGTGDQLVSATFSPVGATVAAASNDGGVHLFNAETGVAERELGVETDNVWAESFSPDGRILATANDDDTVRLWFHHTGAQGHTLAEHRGRVRSIAFAPDGATLATGCDDRKVRIWDTQTGGCRHVLEGHDDRVYAVVYEPKGELLASAGWDGTVRIWDPAQGRCLRVLAGHGGRLWTAAWHPGGGLVTTAGDDSVIHLWDPRSGERLRRLEGHLGRVFAATFSPDGTLLATGGDNGTVRLWDVRDPGAAALRLTLLGQAEGWAALAADGRYKVRGALTGDFWHVVGLSRFEPGELEAHLNEVRRIPIEAAF
ncbi:MAG TPA: TIR domain-containing protein [Micromonosporaceae bacterium]|nr:TIR domain-containing protein [Micromonosporaceae bacterium]